MIKYIIYNKQTNNKYITTDKKEFEREYKKAIK